MHRVGYVVFDQLTRDEIMFFPYQTLTTAARRVARERAYDWAFAANSNPERWSSYAMTAVEY